MVVALLEGLAAGAALAALGQPRALAAVVGLACLAAQAWLCVRRLA